MSTLSVFVLRMLFLRIVEVLMGVQHTHFVILSNKISNKVVAVVCRRFKTNDEAVLLKGTEFGKQQMEAIIVICKFERLD